MADQFDAQRDELLADLLRGQDRLTATVNMLAENQEDILKVLSSQSLSIGALKSAVEALEKDNQDLHSIVTAQGPILQEMAEASQQFTKHLTTLARMHTDLAERVFRLESKVFGEEN